MKAGQKKELQRLGEDGRRERNWKHFGPYLAERQWGTVREDYSADGSAWDYLSHDHARSRAYRWGEDGLCGITDRQCRMCFALALWNGRDPILKERLFGLTGPEGNHGEDVKEVYYYLDSTPTHSYMKASYRYPQAEYPYARLVEEARRRGLHDPELELIDTGVFDDDRFFDVVVEYAKADPDDVLIRITVHAERPFVFVADGTEHRVEYAPAEGTTRLFGGNSNWRGPIWFPLNYLLIEALERYHHFYGDDLKVECPTGSGRLVTLQEVAHDLASRLCRIFLADTQGRRPCHGDDPRFAEDPLWRNTILFHEYFHGDTGRGLGASHQTGWTALVARCLDDLARMRRDGCREDGVCIPRPEAGTRVGASGVQGR